LLFYGRVNTGNMDAILSMSEEQQAHTLALAHSFATQLKEAETAIQLEVEKDLGLENGSNLSLTKPDLTSLGIDNSPNAGPQLTTQDTTLDDGYDLYNT